MNLKPLLIVPPLALGILGYLWMTNREAAPVETTDAARLAVRVQTLEAEPVAMTATGYGRVAPLREWSAVAEVQGRIVELAHGLGEGRIVEAGEVLVAVDPTDYELALQRAKASIAAAEASLSELDKQEENTRRSLDVQNRILDVSRAEFERATRLLESGTGTQASVEASQSGLLAQESAALNLQNTLDLIPAQRAAAEASLSAEQVSLAEAEAALARTTIVAPFRARVASANVETDQFVRTGDQLLVLHATEAVEVVAEFQPIAFSPLALAIFGPDFLPGVEVDATRVIEYMNAAGVTATVNVVQGGFDISYPAEITRFRGTVDEDTGTLGFAVQVQDPLVGNRGDNRPPLNVGTFVAVDVTTPPQQPVIAIPRAVLRYDADGAPFVYVADPGDALAVRPITTGPVLGDRIMVTDGLEAGDRLILSDPRPPVPGLALTPVAVGVAR